MEIITKAASGKFTSKDLAIMYRVKVHVIYDLKHQARRTPKRFLKKKASELAKARHEIAIKEVV